MGILRLYLALCVVAAHVSLDINPNYLHNQSNLVFPWVMLEGSEAVEIFFMISGFYMAMILPKYSNVVEFYWSRFLRIFLPYWLIIGIIITVSLIFGIVWGEWLELEPFVNFYFSDNSIVDVLLISFATFSNLIILFQNWFIVLNYDLPSSFGISPNVLETQYPLVEYLLDPVAWSMAIELIFYFLAPRIVKFSNKKLLFYLLFSLTIRIFFYQYIGFNNWLHHFFVFAFSLFALGIFSFRLYSSWLIKLKKFLPENLQVSNQYYILYFGFVWLILWLINLAILQIGKLTNMNYAYLISHLGWMIIIPILFHLTLNNSIDRYIGNLSYPIYLTHTISIYIGLIIVSHFKISIFWLGTISILLSLLSSVIIIHVLINPLEKHRYTLANILSQKKQSMILYLFSIFTVKR